MPESWTQTVDNLFVSTWSYRRESAMQQAYLKTPLAFWLKEKGRVTPISGHTRIEIPIEYGSNDAIKWLGKGDTVPMTDPDLLTMCYENWKHVAVSITRFGLDDQANRGKAKLLNYVETKLKAAERALWEEFERVFFADGTGANEPNGLQNLISATPTTGTVHGLNRATYPWWRNQQKTSSGAAAVYLFSDMRNLLNTCTKYAKAELQNYVLITDQPSYELYEDECMDQKVIQNQTLADAGFQNIQFKGRPLIWCPSAPSGNMYFVNTDYIELVQDKEYYMQMTEWKPIPDQVNDRVAQILCTQNLVISRPVVHGVLTGIAA